MFIQKSYKYYCYIHSVHLPSPLKEREGETL